MIKLTASIKKLDGTLINIDYRNLLRLGRDIKARHREKRTVRRYVRVQL